MLLDCIFAYIQPYYVLLVLRKSAIFHAIYDAEVMSISDDS